MRKRSDKTDPRSMNFSLPTLNTDHEADGFEA